MKTKTNLLLSLTAAVLLTSSAFGVQRLHVKARDFADDVNRELHNFSVRLHNNRTQESYLSWMGIRLPFNIDVVRVDIDCGILCPDLGDGLFYVNDVTLKQQRFAYNGSVFTWVVEMEDKGREIKGYHNRFGDDWMPDFNMKDIRVATSALPKLVAGGRAGLHFSPSRLTADISSTGGCRLGGIDFCEKLFKTDRRIQKAIEKATNAVLVNTTAQNALTTGVMRVLQSRGIAGPFTRVYLSGPDLILEKP